MEERGAPKSLIELAKFKEAFVVREITPTKMGIVRLVTEVGFIDLPAEADLIIEENRAVRVLKLTEEIIVDPRTFVKKTQRKAIVISQIEGEEEI